MGHAADPCQLAQHRFGQDPQISGHDLQNVVGLAGHRVAVQYFGYSGNSALKREAFVTPVATEGHITDGPHPQAQHGWVEQADVAADYPAAFESLNAPTDLGGRKVNLLTHLLVGSARILLQCGE